jgi:hypothetical protein
VRWRHCFYHQSLEPRSRSFLHERGKGPASMSECFMRHGNTPNQVTNSNTTPLKLEAWLPCSATSRLQ